MKYRPLPDFLLRQVAAAVEAHKSQGSKLCAAFDADGTLWDCDVGELFFDYQVQELKETLGLPQDPWAHYRGLLAAETPKGLAWLAQINKGYPLQTVKTWARTAFEQMRVPVYEDQKRLIAQFLEWGVDVYVVTGSVTWSVEPAAEAIGIPVGHTLGVETEIIDGVVSENVVHPVTWREGKAERFLTKTGGVRPFFVAGNTTGDLNLLELATDVRLCLQSLNPPAELEHSEAGLLEVAKEKGWWTHSFFSTL